MKEGKKRKGFKIFGITVLILIILLIAIVGGTYWYIQDKLSKLQRIDLKEEELRVSTQAEASLVDYRNIAIFGIDSREDSYEKGNRSDCIIIASLNNKTKEIKLLSVYRDTYVQIEGYGLRLNMSIQTVLTEWLAHDNNSSPGTRGYCAFQTTLGSPQER